MENTKNGNHKLLQKNFFFPCVWQVWKINHFKQNMEMITRLEIKLIVCFYVLGGFFALNSTSAISTFGGQLVLRSVGLKMSLFNGHLVCGQLEAVSCPGLINFYPSNTQF